ncbi:MAG: GNAT family N-acetyltransferase [Acidimicrobiales bacterium]
MAQQVRLRRLRIDDRESARLIHHACLQEGSVFLLDYEPSWSWNHYLKHLDTLESRDGLPDGRMPATFFVATLEQNDEILGRISLRHTISTPYLSKVGGHIGYVVTPWQRRRGYGTLMLKAALRQAQSLGIARVLVTTKEDNQGSQTIIERCGGVLEETTEYSEEPGLRRYWIPLSTEMQQDTETSSITEHSHEQDH